MGMENDDAARGHRSLVLICYVLHLVGAVTGILSIIALILNYLKMSVVPPEFDSHHRWMIRTFWWSILFFVIAALLYVTIIMIPVAMLLGVLVWIWYLYRHVKGLLALLDDQPMPR
jgi:uncharacterized membrane protein